MYSGIFLGLHVGYLQTEEFFYAYTAEDARKIVALAVHKSTGQLVCKPCPAFVREYGDQLLLGDFRSRVTCSCGWMLSFIIPSCNAALQVQF